MPHTTMWSLNFAKHLSSAASIYVLGFEFSRYGVRSFFVADPPAVTPACLPLAAAIVPPGDLLESPMLFVISGLLVLSSFLDGKRARKSSGLMLP